MSAAAAQFVHDLKMRGRALEIHVLQQMRHPGLAVALMARPDFVGHIDAHCAARLIGVEQDL